MLGTRQQPGDHAVLALPDGSRRALAAHGAVDGLDGDLAGQRRGVGLPAGDQALAGLTGRGGQVQGLTDRVVDGLRSKPQHGADTGGDRGSEVGDVVDLVLVQADAFDQVDLHLVCGGDAADQVTAADVELLGHRDQGRDVVTRVRVLGGQEGVVEVEFAHGNPVGPGGPFGE